MKQRPVRLPSVDDDVLPLPEGVLTTNLGLDIVVVVTKVTQLLHIIYRRSLFNWAHSHFVDWLYDNIRERIRLPRWTFWFYAAVDSTVLSSKWCIVILHKRKRRQKLWSTLQIFNTSNLRFTIPNTRSGRWKGCGSNVSIIEWTEEKGRCFHSNISIFQSIGLGQF